MGMIRYILFISRQALLVILKITVRFDNQSIPNQMSDDRKSQTKSGGKREDKKRPQ